MTYEEPNYRCLARFWCQVWVSSCGTGLKSKQNVVGDSYGVCATIVPLGTSCQVSHYCRSKRLLHVRLVISFLLW